LIGAGQFPSRGALGGKGDLVAFEERDVCEGRVAFFQLLFCGGAGTPQGY